MLKIVAAGLAIGIALGGAAMAQTPMTMQPNGVLLVKHDDDDGPGRKLGHYKHKPKHKHADQDRHWNRSTRSPYGYYPHRRNDDAPRRSYSTRPGYGSSYPPGYGYPRFYESGH